MSQPGLPGAVKIGDLTRSTGVSDQAVRYYERLGLIHSAGRTPGGFRLFGLETIDRIRMIKEAQSLGFKLEDIRQLLDVRAKGDATCHAAQGTLDAKLKDLDERIAMLSLHRDILLSMRRDCDLCQGICLIPDHFTDPGEDPHEGQGSGSASRCS